MAVFEVQGPDGAIYEIDAPDEAAAVSAFQQYIGQQPQQAAQPSIYDPASQLYDPAAPPRPEGLTSADQAAMAADAAMMGYQPPAPYEPSVAGYAGQFGAGSQEGIAQMLGFPVDAVASGLSGIGGLTGLWGEIKNPIGGAASWDAALAPFNENIPSPQNSGERFARRIGEEVGASAVTAPIALAAMPVRAGAVLGTEAASALGSGTGAAVAQEVAPDSVTAEVIGALLGGIPAGALASRALGLNGTASDVRGGIDEMRQRAADAYGEVRADQRVLPSDSTFNLGLDIDHRMAQERLNPRLQPGASAVRDAIIDDVMQPMRIEDVENLRRMTQQIMPVTASPADQRLAGVMRDQITDYLDNIGDPVSDALREGRDAHRRASAATAVSEAAERGSRRAATSGSGGNEINAMRQNLRSIIDSPRKSRSFSKAELAAMEDIVRGTAGQNALRSFSRFAPTSGGLSAMLGIGGAMASPAVALPIMAATEGAKYLGERSTRKVVDALMQSIAPDRVMSVGESGITPIIQALLGARITAEDR